MRRALIEKILQPKVEFKVIRKLETENQNPYPIGFVMIGDHSSCRRKERKKGHMNEFILSPCLLFFRFSVNIVLLDPVVFIYFF